MVKAQKYIDRSIRRIKKCCILIIFWKLLFGLICFASADPAPIRIMPFGDSFTAGLNYRNFSCNIDSFESCYHSYRRYLWHLLKSANYDVQFLGEEVAPGGAPKLPDWYSKDYDPWHEGHLNQTTGQLKEILQSEEKRNFLKENKPDIVLFLGGVNDLRNRVDINITINNLREIVDEFREHNSSVRMLLGKLYQVTEPGAYVQNISLYNEGVLEFNRKIGELARSLSSLDSQVFVVNINQGFDNQSDIQGNGDHLHPNRTGEEKIAQKWFDMLRYFVLDGKCLGYDHTGLKVAKVPTTGDFWFLRFGDLAHIGNYSPNQEQADRALQVIRHYGLNRWCWLGDMKLNTSMEYYLINGSELWGASGESPTAAMEGEECINFEINNLSIRKIGGRWKIFPIFLDFGNDETSARIAYGIIRRKGFNHICFVGQEYVSMIYFRR